MSDFESLFDFSTLTFEEVRRFHEKSDVDSSHRAQHHTLGTKAEQAAAGNHKHKPAAFVRKSANATKANSTYANDSELFFAVKKGHTYYFEIMLIWRNTGSDTPDGKTQISWTGTCNVSVVYTAGATINAGQANATLVGVHGDPAIAASPTTSRAWSVTNQWTVVKLTGNVVCTEDGVVSLAWAQNGTDAVNLLEVATGSQLIAWEVA